MVDLQKILNEMSTEEKIGQLTQYNAQLFTQSSALVTGPDAALNLTGEDLQRVGSVLNFSSVAEMKAIQAQHLQHDRHGIPLVFMMDVIHGYRTIFPIPLGLSCSFDPGLAEECSRMAAQEASASGIQVTFTPMVDYSRDPRWGRVMEGGGEEPLLTGAMAAAQIRGFQGDDLSAPGNIATCVKHYAGYGGAEAGRDYNQVELSERELRQFYLPAYKACLDAGSPMIMPSFNSLNGVPSIANTWLMKKVLRDEWGFEGLVISDYNAVGELINHGVAADLKEAARLAFAHGCDMEMCSSAYIHHLAELVEEGVFSMDQLNAAVLRILRFKDTLGLFEDPCHGADQAKADALCLSDAHRSIVRRAACESAVLLKNDGVLPFSRSLRRIALIGPFANEHAILGSWSCNGDCAESTTVFDGVAEALPDAQLHLVRGCGCEWNDTDASGIAAAVDAARAADAVILCLGEPQHYSGEGNCRADLRLPGMQEELARQVLAANANAAVLLFNGRPLVLSAWSDLAPAILEMWYPGTEGGRAAADLLFGRANPCGKLSMTFPWSVGQVPVYYNHPNTGRPHWTHAPAHNGYSSDYIGCPTLPLYSFGHGLSYSRFVYESLSLSAQSMTADTAITVTVTLRNDSSVPGKETVQLYIRDLVGSVVRPVQQLIAFEKVALAPQETRQVTFTITEPMLRFWNADGECLSEPGDFQVSTGWADHLILTQQFRLADVSAG